MVLKNAFSIHLKRKEELDVRPSGLENVLDYGVTFIICTLSALVFAFGFNLRMDMRELKYIRGEKLR